MKRMNFFGRLLLCVCLLLLATSLLACTPDPGPAGTPCLTHTDGDGDGKCDKCATPVENEEICDDHIDINGDNKCEICGATVVEEVAYSLTVKLEDGTPIPQITISLLQNGKTIASGKTGDDGCVKGTILPGNYTILMDGFAEGQLPSGNGSTIAISAEKGSYEFFVTDNTPDGSKEKPYFVGDEAVEIVFPAGQTYHYFGKGSSAYLIIHNENVKVTYNGRDYLPEDGTLQVLIKGTADTNSTTPFTLTNTSAAENTIVAEFIPLPGSSGDPYEAKLGETMSATVGVEESIYFALTAPQDGYLVLHSDTPSNYIMMYNMTSMIVTGYTDGGHVLYLPVKKGDLISIPVASRASGSSNQVEFVLSLVSGTAEDPITLSESSGLRLPAGGAVTLVYRGENATLTIPAAGLSLKDAAGNEVTYTGTSYRISVADGDVLTLSNTTNATVEIVFTLTALAA